MHLTFSPTRSDTVLTVTRSGDSLTINGETFDFSAVPEGATLPRDAIACEWLAGDVTRQDGILNVPLILPHGPNGPDETRFPAPVTVTADGPVDLPPHDTQQEDLPE